GKINNTSPDKIIDQIAGEIKETANNDGGRVKITLNPPSLGKLEMDVTVRNGKVEVVLVADNKDVQQTLNANIEKLKENLFNQGLTIDRCDVSMQDKKEEYQQNFNRQAYYQDGGSAKDGNNRQENSDKEVNSGTGTGISLQPGSALRAFTDNDNISLFA
ncbi:MAG: flagellar hook-length control protein FliK, partial [Syntrophaceae bacterium]|nr:flagellar hook-length control protein FliK [Syntrophaceae bacterium]